jgi:ATP-dependent Clp protease adaptor protein ClpS
MVAKPALPKTAAVVEQERILMPLYKVILHNDEMNAMDHVVRALMRVFKFAQEECERIMWEAHHNGLALCAVEPLEQAELHRDQLQSFSLTATIEPE